MSVARAIRQAYDDRLAPLGLNLSQASSLAFLNEFGPHTQSQLASRLGLGRAATGTMVDQLEGRGMLQRLPDAADRRVWRLELTEVGAAAAREIAAVDVALRSRLREGFSRADRQQLAGMLLRLQRNLADTSGQ